VLHAPLISCQQRCALKALLALLVCPVTKVTHQIAAFQPRSNAHWSQYTIKTGLAYSECAGVVPQELITCMHILTVSITSNALFPSNQSRLPETVRHAPPQTRLQRTPALQTFALNRMRPDLSRCHVLLPTQTQLTNLELGFPAQVTHIITPDSFLYNLSLLEMDTRMMEVSETRSDHECMPCCGDCIFTHLPSRRAILHTS
jgi:hypothetical protein